MVFSISPMQCHDDNVRAYNLDESRHAISNDLLRLEHKNRMPNNQDHSMYRTLQAGLKRFFFKNKHINLLLFFLSF